MAICENTIEFSLTLRDLLSFENWRGGAKGIRGGGIAPPAPPLATALLIHENTYTRRFNTYTRIHDYTKLGTTRKHYL